MRHLEAAERYTKSSMGSDLALVRRLSKSTFEPLAEDSLAKARGSLADFTAITKPDYVTEPVHALLCAALHDVIDHRVDRLMIIAPPQHGKSELVSVRLPAYWLGREPGVRIAISSYAATLAEYKSSEIKSVMLTDAYQQIFPQTALRSKRSSTSFWRTTAGGTLWAGGVGGPITGHGFNVGIIDDPFENWAQAQSTVIRRGVWDWYRATLRPRIWEHGAIVLITTRWHQSDLAGMILSDQPEAWRVLRLPALAETQAERDSIAANDKLPLGQPDPLGRQPGEPLAPNRYSLAELNRLKRDIGSMAWMAEYQGTPQAPGGNMFKEEWFRIQADGPRRARERVRYWDKAASTDGKRTAGVLMSESEGVFYVEHVVMGQWTTFARRQVMLKTAQLDGRAVKIGIEQEPGSSGVDSIADEKRLLAGWTVKADVPTGSKDTRLEGFATQLEAGNVVLVEGDWNRAFIEELLMIPNGTYRDQSDAAAGAFNMLTAKKPVAGTWGAQS